MAIENRQFSRVKFAAQTIVAFGANRVEAVLVDISLKGALLQIANPMSEVQANERCELSIALDASDVVMYFDAEVAHFREDLIGVRFVGVDIDTMIHLRSLLEFNTADPDQVRNELAIFLGAK